MRLKSLLFILALAAPLCAGERPYEGWTPEQLKAEIERLNAEIGSIKQFCPDLPPPAPSSDLKIDDFEGDTASIGVAWWAGTHDQAGSSIQPSPFVHAAGGAHGKYCGRIHGHLGKDEHHDAWVAFNISPPDPDLRGYKAIEFWAKGDGKAHGVRLEKMSVRDYAHFEASFVAPEKWAKISIPFDAFKQPDHGKKVAASFRDINKIAFFPREFGSDFDLSIDDVVLRR